MSDTLGTPVTELDPTIRLARVERDLVTIGLLAATTARDQLVTLLAAIYGRATAGTPLEPRDAELATLFNNAWVIVDRLHMLNCVLRPHLIKAPKGTSAAEFWTHLQAVRLVRNRMDHVDPKRQAGKTSKPDFPIFGVITAVMFDPAQIKDGTIEWLDNLVLSHSEFHAKLNLLPTPDKMDGVQAPVDHIRLHAFETVIDLSRAVRLAEGLTSALTDRQAQPPTPDARLQVVVRQNFHEPLRLSVSVPPDTLDR